MVRPRRSRSEPRDTRNGSSIIEADPRAEAIDWARRILQEPDVIFLDTETTGLDDGAEVVDIAIIDRNGDVLLDTLVRPSDMIPSAATDIHGIDDPAVADAPTWDSVYPLVGRILDRHGPVVVYNAEFDQRVLSRMNRVNGLPDFDVDWHCAMKRFAEFAGEWHPRHETWRWHKLEVALQMTGRPAPSVRHRALADADSCRQIVEAMAIGVTTRPPASMMAGGSGRERDGEPLQPEVIRPGEERRREGPGWSQQSGNIGGTRYTVISTRSSGCSSGALLLILVVGIILIGLCCCAFFYSAMALA